MKLLIPLLLLAACTGARQPYAGNLDALLASNPLADGEKVKIIKLVEGRAATWQVVLLRVDVPAHVHKKSAETVQFLRGKGVFEIGGVKHQVKVGDVYHVPKGTVHSFRLESAEAAVLSTFTPGFQPGDRHYIK